MEPSRRLPANNCLLDFLVVLEIGLRVVDVDGAGVVVVVLVDRGPEELIEFNLV